MANTFVSRTFNPADSGGYDAYGSYFPQSTAAAYSSAIFANYETVYYAYDPAPIASFINSLLPTSVTITLSYHLSNGWTVLHNDNGDPIYGDPIKLDTFTFADNATQEATLSHHLNTSIVDDLYKNSSAADTTHLLGDLTASYTVPNSLFTTPNGLYRGFLFSNDETYVTRVSDMTLTVSGYQFNNLPVIAGLDPNLTTLDSAAVTPFSHVTVSYPGTPVSFSDDIIITIEDTTGAATGNLGTLSLPAGMPGSLVAGEAGSLTPMDGPGRYTLYGYSNGASHLVEDLRSLVFTPTNLGAGASPQRVTFELKYEASAGYQGVTTATEGLLVSHDPGAPSISNATFVQPVLDDARVKPFTGLVLTDPLSGADDVVTIRVIGANDQPTGASGTLQTTAGSATLTSDGAGTYTLRGGGSFAALTSTLQNLAFVAAPRVAGSLAIDTPLNVPLVVTLSTAHGAVSDDNTTVVITHDIRPTVTGETASQPLLDNQTIQPFAGLSVSNAGAAPDAFFTISLVGPTTEHTNAYGALRTTSGSATLTGDGFGNYTLSGGGGFTALVDTLQHLEFDPALRAAESPPITVSFDLGISNRGVLMEYDGTSVTISHSSASDLIYVSAAGSAPITFSRAAMELIVDDVPSGGATLPNTLIGLSPGNTIDLTHVPYVPGAAAAVRGNTLVLSNGGLTETFNLGGPLDAAAQVTPDGAGGTLVTIVHAPPSIGAISYDAQTATLAVNGAHMTASASDFQVTGFTVTGQNGQSYTLTSASLVGTPSAGGFNIRLGDADAAQVGLLLDQNGTTSQSGTSYSFAAAAGWDANQGLGSSVSISVVNSFDPATHTAAATNMQQLRQGLAAVSSATSGRFIIDVAGVNGGGADPTSINLHSSVSLALVDPNGTGGIGGATGDGALLVQGQGTVSLQGVNTYRGGTVIGGGTLQIGPNATAGSGPITFGATAWGTLAFVFSPNGSVTSQGGVLQTETFINVIKGFMPSDTIDLQGAGLETVATANGGNSFTFSGAGDKAVTLNFDPLTDFSPYRFNLSADGQGGTNVTLGKAAGSAFLGTAQQSIKDDATGARPFQGVRIADPNIVQNETVTVRWDATRGSLSDGLNTFSTGTLTYGGTAADASVYLENLVFRPAKVVGQPSTTVSFTLFDTNAGGQTVTDSTTVVRVLPANTAPTVQVSPGVALDDHHAASPLASAIVSDPDSGQTETIMMTLTPADSADQASDANGRLSLAGQPGFTLVETAPGSGSYTLSGTSGTGIAALNAALQAVAFTPTANQATPGQTVTTGLSVRIGDGAATASASTTLTVTALNDAPTVSGISVRTVLNDHQTAAPLLDVTLADPDFGQIEAVQLSLQNVAGQATDLNGTLSLPGTLGTLVKSGIGTYTLAGMSGSGIGALQTALAAVLFTPTEYQVTPGQTITTVLGVSVGDGTASAGSTATLAVTALNDKATIGGVATGSVQESVTPVASGKLTIVDPDFGQAVFAMPAAAALAGTYGKFTFDSLTGGWTYGLNAQAANVQALAQGQTATDQFTATSIDGTASQVVTATITGTNAAPVFAANATTGSIGESAATIGSVTADSASGSIGFTDVDLTDRHVLGTAAPTFLWSGGTLSAAQVSALSAASSFAVTETDSVGIGAGSVAWAYRAADRTFDFLGAGQTLTINEAVTIDDGHGGVATKPVTVTITGANDAPAVSGATGSRAIAESANATGSTAIDSAAGSFQFTDPDVSDTHLVSAAAPSFAWSGGPLAAAQISALTVASSFVLIKVDSTGSGTGSVGWTLSAADSAFDFVGAGQTLTITEAVTIDDTHGGVVTTPVTVTVTGANDAPIIAGTVAGQKTTDYDSIKPFASASVSDADLGAVDSMTITLFDAQGKATDANGLLSGANKSGTGTYTLAAQSPAALTTALRALTFTPARAEVLAGKTVSTTFALTATDGAATTRDSATSVTATALNTVNGPSSGLGVLAGTAGADVFSAHGYGNVILGGGGNDVIDAGSGLAAVRLGDGDASVMLGGGVNAVVGGNGNVTVTGAPGGFTAVTLGTGNDVVRLGGVNNVVTLGNGANRVVLTGGQARVGTGVGNDTITIAGRGNAVDAGGGVNVISGGAGMDEFVLPVAGKGFDLLSGFDVAHGDVLDLRTAMAATSWNHASSTLGNYLKVTTGGGATNIAVAPAGSGAGTSIASLTNTTYGLDTLLNHHSLLI